MNTLIGIIQDHIVWRHQLLKLAKADIVKTYWSSIRLGVGHYQANGDGARFMVRIFCRTSC